MAISSTALQTAIAEPDIDIAGAMRHAMTHHGKSALSQLSEIWRLRFGRGKLHPAEYYYYRLYDDERYSFEDKLRFLGKAGWNRIYRQCSKVDWWAIAHDKLAFYALLEGQRLPAPENLALFHRYRRSGDLPVLTSAEALAQGLRDRLTYPVFAKPVTGIRSVGVASLQRYDADSDSLTLSSGDSVGVDDYVREVKAYENDGYLFQSVLAPHERIAALSGGRLATVRLIVGLEAEGPRLMHALWKVPVGHNPADNFWRPGNILGALEPETGRVRRLVTGVGPDQQEVTCHPDSGQQLLGATLPDWAAALDACLTAASMFSGLRLQAWDVALTDRGPVLLEVNIGGDFNLPQLALAAGIMNPAFEEFLVRTGSAEAEAA